MVIYTCEKCGESFNNLHSYKHHTKNKTKCYLNQRRSHNTREGNITIINNDNRTINVQHQKSSTKKYPKEACYTNELVAGRQYYKCANRPETILRGLKDYQCPLWQISNQSHRGCFDQSGYKIDHVYEFCKNYDRDINNLHALCLSCHTVKTQSYLINQNEFGHCDSNNESDYCDQDDSSSESHYCDNCLRKDYSDNYSDDDSDNYSDDDSDDELDNDDSDDLDDESDDNDSDDDYSDYVSDSDNNITKYDISASSSSETSSSDDSSDQRCIY